MHCINVLDIVCLYSFRSTMMVTVIVHSFPFHCHFLTISIWLYNGVEDFNKTILLSRFSMFDHKNCNHVLNLFTAWNCTTSTFWINCPIKVSSGITILDSCNTVCIDGNFKINEKNVYLLMSLFGQFGTIIQMVLGFRSTHTQMSS